MSQIALNLTEEALEAIGKYFGKPEDISNEDFAQQKLVGQVTNWVTEQRNVEALAQLAEAPIPNVEEQ